MSIEQKGRTMTPAMRNHWDSLAVMSPDQLEKVLRAHDAMTSPMLDAMAADVKGMSIATDQA